MRCWKSDRQIDEPFTRKRQEILEFLAWEKAAEDGMVLVDL